MANMTRWDPFGDMLTLRDAMNQLFSESFVRPGTLGRGQATFDVPLDVHETQDGYVVDASVPGVKPDDINITLENGVLTISGETKHEHKAGEDQGSYHRIERRFGSFTRAIQLPTDVDADQVKANLENGVLHIEIPKAEQVKPRKITVNSGQGSQKQVVDAQAHGQQSQQQGQKSREHGA